MSNDLDALIVRLATVCDEALEGEARRSGALLLDRIIEFPAQPRKARPLRARVLAVAFVLVLAAILSLPAFGVGDDIASLFGKGRDPDQPVPMASDVVVASGVNGVSWKILATTSDQGLCLGMRYRFGGDTFGPGACGYTGIRGELPRGIRGDPSERCLGPATKLEPGGTIVSCGSLPLHWIELGGSEAAGLEARFSFGPLAEDVTGVELVLTDGRRLDAHIVKKPGGLPLNFYWASWPCPLTAVEDGNECAEGGQELALAIARGAGGQVLERRAPAWNMNPTGDPEGPLPPEPEDGPR